MSRPILLLLNDPHGRDGAHVPVYLGGVGRLHADIVNRSLKELVRDMSEHCSHAQTAWSANPLIPLAATLVRLWLQTLKHSTSHAAGRDFNPTPQQQSVRVGHAQLVERLIVQPRE